MSENAAVAQHPTSERRGPAVWRGRGGRPLDALPGNASSGVQLSDLGLPQVVRAALAGASGALLLLGGCSALGGASTRLESIAPAPYGVGQVMPDGTTPMLVGVAPWCVTDGPVRITKLAWEKGSGADIVAYSVVNQSAADDRVGTDIGDLAASNFSPAQTDVTSRCKDPLTNDDQISYVVLQMRPTHPQEVAHGSSLVASWQDESGHRGTFTEPFDVVLCPPGTPECSEVPND